MQNKNNNNTNFWISYADLMAGLLFVFILLIGAIIVKYTLLEDESNALEESLLREKIALEKNKKELDSKDIKINKILNDLKKVEKKFKIAKEDLKEALLKNEQYKNEIDFKDELISKIKLKQDALNENLDSTKKELKTTQKEKESLFVSLNQLQDLTKEKDQEIEKLLASNNDLQNLTKEKDEELKKLIEELVAKKNLIQSFEEKNLLLNDEIKVMVEKIKKSEELHEKLSLDLANTKERIKSFTGLKVKVITKLKQNLGEKIQIDPKNGSLRLSSNILFDEGKFVLKDEAKASLKDALYDYFKTILENDEINKHIDKIIIEGHTNSKGTYLYNLDLSQKRAFSVMDFLLSLDFENQEKLKKLILASGRAFLDPIYTSNGVEDSDASRRIEIKLSLKNEDAIKEISKLLE